MTITSASIPATGFVRIKQILHLIPVSPSTWWAGVASGKYPPAIKLGARTTVWRAEDIHALIETLGHHAPCSGKPQQTEYNRDMR